MISGALVEQRQPGTWKTSIPCFLVLLSLICAVGCSDIPFRQVEMCPLYRVDPAEARSRFQDEVPLEFNLLNSVVFEYRGHDFSTLGMIAVEVEARAFRLVCLTPMGVKTLDIAGDKNDTTCEFSLSGFLDTYANNEDMARAMGKDIRRMYFDLVPHPDAVVRRERAAIIFETSLENGCMEHVFAGPDAVLIEKRYYEDGSRTCRVGFYEYVRRNGKLYPGGIILDNWKYGYRLIVRLKEVG